MSRRRTVDKALIPRLVILSRLEISNAIGGAYFEDGKGVLLPLYPERWSDPPGMFGRE